MGAAAIGRCHASNADALTYLCAAAFPYSASGITYSCTGVSGAALTIGVSTIPSGCTGSCTATTGTTSITPALQACDETTWLQYYPLSLSAGDGLLISAALVAVFLLAWAARATRAATD